MFSFSAALPLNPVAVYPLNAEYGTKDISDNRLPAATAVGTVLVEGPNGEPGGSHYLTGDVRTSYIEFPQHPLLDARRSIAIAAWVFPLSEGPLFDYSATWAVHLWIGRGTNLILKLSRRTSLVLLPASVNPLTFSEWHYIAVSYDYSSGSQKMWVDGNMIERNVGTAELATNYSARMGTRYDSNFSRFKGRVSCLQVYNNSLSDAQVHATRDSRCFGTAKGKLK